MGLSLDVSRFIADLAIDAVPDDVVHLAKRSILDGLGLGVAGSRSDAGRIVAEHVLDQGSRPEASLLGTGAGASARLSALANGVSIHADDYDDTQLAVSPDRVYGLLTHPTAPVLPSVLAVAERDDRSGTDLLVAYLAGTEVATKVAEAIDPRHYDDGFHSTGTMGAIGSGVAAGKLVGLDARAIAMCLAVSASQAAGLRENFGTMTKPFHAGRAAESGVVAADLVRRGFTATDSILEAKRGFFSAAGGGYDPILIESKLGNPWTFATPGISIKPHPSGSLTHPGMGAMSALIAEHDIRPEQVKRVMVGTNRHMPNALIHHRPKTDLEAKFSMEFCMAILLLERKAGLSEFTDEIVNRPDVQAMIERVDFAVNDEAEADDYSSMTTIIDVELNDGSLLSTRASFGKGSPLNPMSDEELEEKFLQCMEWGGKSESVGRVVAERVFDLEKEPSIRALTKLVNQAGDR